MSETLPAAEVSPVGKTPVLVLLCYTHATTNAWAGFGLLEFSHLLKKRPRTFAIGEIPSAEVGEYCLAYAIANCDKDDAISVAARNAAEGRESVDDFLRGLFYAFYRAGLVALKTSTFDAFQWSFEEEASLSASTVDLQTKVTVHPMFFRVLGTQLEGQASAQ